MRDRRRDDDPGCPVVERAYRAVVREETEDLRARCQSGEHRDAERRVRGEPARTSELPEEEIHLAVPCRGDGGLRRRADAGRERRRGGRARARRSARRRGAGRRRARRVRCRDGRGLKRRVRRVEMCGRVAERAREDRERGEERPELQRPRGNPAYGFAAGGAGGRAPGRPRRKGGGGGGVYGGGGRGAAGGGVLASRGLAGLRGAV